MTLIRFDPSLSGPAWRRVWAPLLGLALSGCLGDPGVSDLSRDPDPPATRPNSGEENRWELGPEPLVELGSVDMEAPDLFGYVGQVLLLSDGGVAVVDRSPLRVALFDSAGQFTTARGRAGEGPGEFGAMPAVREVSPDTLLAWDPMLKRFTWFDLTAGGVRTRMIRSSDAQLALPRSYIPNTWKMGRDGTLAVVDRLTGPDDRVLVLSPQDSLLVLATHPRRSRVLTERVPPSGARYSLSSPFRGSVGIAMRPNGTLLVSDPDTWRIQEFSQEGNPLGSFEPAIARRAVAPLLAEGRRAVLAGSINAAAERAAAYDQLTHPDSTAAIGNMLHDGCDRLWIQRWKMPLRGDQTRYEIFRDDGVWLGWAAIPIEEGFVQAVSTNRIALKRTDALGVSHVAVHRLIAPGGGRLQGVEEGPGRSGECTVGLAEPMPS